MRLEGGAGSLRRTRLDTGLGWARGIRGQGGDNSGIRGQGRKKRGIKRERGREKGNQYNKKKPKPLRQATGHGQDLESGSGAPADISAPVGLDS